MTPFCYALVLAIFVLHNEYFVILLVCAKMILILYYSSHILLLNACDIHVEACGIVSLTFEYQSRVYVPVLLCNALQQRRADCSFCFSCTTFRLVERRFN